MPSANSAGINFSSTAFLWEMQNPLPAINFASTGFLWQMQNPLPAINFESTPFLWELQTTADAVLLQEPPTDYGNQSTQLAEYLSSGTSVNIVATINYYQRVYSSGLNLWCYYTTQNGTDSSPLPAVTTPNWTGSITSYELITSIAV